MTKDNYPEPSMGQPGNGDAVWRVVLLALALIGIAAVLTIFADQISQDMIVILLVVLAVVGVFSLFALAAGLFRFSAGTERRTLSRSVLDSAVRGILVTERDGAIVYANEYYAKMARQVSDGALVGVPRLFANQPEASEAIYRLGRAARDGRKAVEDLRLTRDFLGHPLEGQKPRWYRIMARDLPLTEGATKPLVVWTVEDITSDRDNQENIYLELQRAIDYLDHAPAGFFSADSRGRVQYLNSTLADWLGYDLADFEPGDLRLSQIVQGDGANLLMGGRAGGDIRTEVIDLDLVHRNGTTYPVRLLHRAARLADGELGETRTLVLDRLVGQAGEDDVRAMQMRFARFFNDTPFAIATLDGEGRIAHTNAPFNRVFGVRAETQSVENMPFADLIAEGQRAKFAEAFEAVLDRKADVEPLEADLSADAERGVRLYFTAAESVTDSDEKVIVYALDTTDHRRLQAQFAQGQKMQAVGQLAGGVAHDFNNVLTAIIGFSDLLLLKHKPSDPSFSDIMSIKQSANRAAGLVRQLLAFSRRQTLRPQVLDLTNTINELNEFLKRLIGEKITLEVAHDSELWPVRVDQTQLEQVIVNLVVNARDAIADGGSIKVKTRNVWSQEAETFDYQGMPAADYVLIEVADTGSGMPPDVVEKIFEPFFSTKELGKGTGLGLSTVYGIIKQTGGFIYVETEPGNGTSFRIFLPRHVVAPEEQKAANVEHAVKDLTGNERILLVEDEESVRAFSARALSATGYEVFEADSGEEALEVLDDIDNEIDLIISDVVMPVMDGPTLLIEVRKRLPDVKFIFVSGYAEESVRQDLADDRSVEFLAKPYTLDQINTKVKDVLSAVDEGGAG